MSHETLNKRKVIKKYYNGNPEIKVIWILECIFRQIGEVILSQSFETLTKEFDW